jgi:hypothetical protein
MVHFSVELLLTGILCIGYLALQLNNGNLALPFFFTIPLPIGLIYFGQYFETKFKKASEVNQTFSLW